MASRSAVQGLRDGQRVVTEGNLFLQQILAEAKVPPVAQKEARP